MNPARSQPESEGPRQGPAGSAAPLLSAAGRASAPDVSIETLRITATFLLVSYHITNAPEMKALLGPAHPLTLFGDFFVDLRMPLFAFIAGLVYAIRPIGEERLAMFVAGKTRRLLVPGALAALLFAAVAAAMGSRFAVPLHDVWRILLFPYVHFWFLQAIFLVLIAVAASEKFFGPRVMQILFAVFSAALIGGVRPTVDVFALVGACFLMPYFTLGVLAWRHRDGIDRAHAAVLATALVLLLIGCLWQLQSYAAEGVFSGHRRDLQSWTFAVGACLALFLCRVRVPALAAFGAFSFTIYLYHVFGTSGARKALLILEVSNVWLLFVAGVAGGFAVPIALHLLAMRIPLARRLMLGLR